MAGTVTGMVTVTGTVTGLAVRALYSVFFIFRWFEAGTLETSVGWVVVVCLFVNQVYQSGLLHSERWGFRWRPSSPSATGGARPRIREEAEAWSRPKKLGDVPWIFPQVFNGKAGWVGRAAKNMAH